MVWTAAPSALAPRPATGRSPLRRETAPGGVKSYRSAFAVTPWYGRRARRGGVVKATGERWYGGWTVGWPEPKWTPGRQPSTEEE